MAHEQINLNAKMTKFLVNELKIFADSPLTILDVGARGGSEQHWQIYGEQLYQIGLEPDLEECQKLNQELASFNYKFYPVALGRCKELRTFYLCQEAAGSSFYPANLQFLQRFPDEHSLQMQVLKTLEIETVDLDYFVNANQISSLDFIKLDVEGSELDCLQGAVKSLKNSVLGLSLEVLFHSNLRNQPTFSEIDLLLNSFGFRLFDLSIYRYARKALPLPTNQLGATRKGQVMWGQALYLRDGFNEIQSNQRLDFWDEVRILKLASIMEVFCLQDCAAELLEIATQRNILKRDLTQLLDYLTPTLRKGDTTRFISYENYLKYFTTVQQ